MKGILEQAAKEGIAQMRAQSFADRRPERIVWPDRKWEWASLRFEDGDFNTAYYMDTTAREKWFYQAIGASPAMFRRDTQAGSLYWLGLRDKTGAYLDGGKTYKLTVPLPVPRKLFWSVTVYDASIRSQIQTNQGKAALRSLFELKDLSGKSVDLHFGPKAPKGEQGRWIKTNSRQGLVCLLPYLRAGAAGVRRHLEAGRLRRDQMNSAARRLNENQKNAFPRFICIEPARGRGGANFGGGQRGEQPTDAEDHC
jgi:hypothetical protein